MTRLYLDAELGAGRELDLPEEAVRHLVQVLRMQAGETLTVFNGRGGEYTATLSSVERRRARLAIGAHDAADRESALRVHIAQCVSKGDRMDYALQKATELGAAGFTPLLSRRGNVKVDAERWEKKTEHWRGVVVGAAEQSGRTALPSLVEPLDFDGYVSAPMTGLKLILAPGGNCRLAELPLAADVPVTALIGPEGGFDAGELQLADRHGWLRLALGPRILRTETAPVALLAALHARYDGLLS